MSNQKEEFSLLGQQGISVGKNRFFYVFLSPPVLLRIDKIILHKEVYDH